MTLLFPCLHNHISGQKWRDIYLQVFGLKKIALCFATHCLDYTQISSVRFKLAYLGAR